MRETTHNLMQKKKKIIPVNTKLRRISYAFLRGLDSACLDKKPQVSGSMETGKERFQEVALFWTLAKDGKDARCGINWSQDPK